MTYDTIRKISTFKEAILHCLVSPFDGSPKLFLLFEDGFAKGLQCYCLRQGEVASFNERGKYLTSSCLDGIQVCS